MSAGAYTLADVDKPKGQFTAADVDSTPKSSGMLDKANEFAGKALSSASLPTSIANIPDWFHHLTGTAKDSEPFWEPIKNAIKNPTQENIVNAVPFVGPAAVSMSKDVKQGNYWGAAGSLAGTLAAPLAAGEIKPGATAAKTELTEATRTPENKLTPAARAAARVAGAAVGHEVVPGAGAVAGAIYGPQVADAVLPNRPPTPDFHGGAYSDFAGESGKPTPISKSPNYDPAAYKAGAAARTSQPTDTPAGTALQPGGRIVDPASAPPPVNKTLVSYDRNLLVHMANGGDLNALRELIRNPGSIDVGTAVPNSKFLLEGNQPTRIYGGPGPATNPTTATGLSNLKGTITRFDAQGKPIQLSDLGAEDYLHSLGREVPDVEVSGGRTSANASGESSASLEAQSRLATEKNQGVQRVRVDTRSGQEVPLTGVDAVDAKAGPYDRIVMRDKNGAEIVLDEGQKALPKRPANPSGFRTGTPQ